MSGMFEDLGAAWVKRHTPEGRELLLMLQEHYFEATLPKF
jgi:hypothetical protein